MPAAKSPAAASRRISRSWLAACLLVLPAGALAGALGMVADNGAKQLAIFDADLDQVKSTLVTGHGHAMADCSVTSDERVGFSASAGSRLAIIDLDPDRDAAQPVHASLEISNLGVDMSLSPDDTMLVLAGGGEIQAPLSVIDTRARREISATSLFVDHTSVEFCDNGTLLVTTTHGEFFDSDLDNALYDARLGPDGAVSLRGNRLSSGAAPNNSACAPGSFTGVLLDRAGGVTSFGLPDLEAVQFERLATGVGVAASFDAHGHRLFVRTTGGVEAFHFDPVSGAMVPAWSRSHAGSLPYYGIDQIAVHPEGNKLYVDSLNGMMILDPASGQRVGGMDLGHTTGVCFANARPAGGAERVAQLARMDATPAP